MPGEDIEQDYIACGFGWEEDEYIVTGPNARNTAKLIFARESKRRQHDYDVTLKVRTAYDRYRKRTEVEHVISCIPTEAGRARLVREHEAFVEEWNREHPDHPWRDHDGSDSEAWRHASDVRPKKPRRKRRSPDLGRPPILDEFDLIERQLLIPRCRKERGWGRIYRPTRLRRYGRDDRKCWKRHRRSQWSHEMSF